MRRRRTADQVPRAWRPRSWRSAPSETGTSAGSSDCALTGWPEKMSERYYQIIDNDTLKSILFYSFYFSPKICGLKNDFFLWFKLIYPLNTMIFENLLKISVQCRHPRRWISLSFLRISIFRKLVCIVDIHEGESHLVF